MHILLTGASGLLGSHTLLYLLRRNHTVTAIDLTPLHPNTLAQLDAIPENQRGRYTFHQVDLITHEPLKNLLISNSDISGVIHLGAIPDPLRHEPRHVHHNNVVSNYNVLYTCAELGIDRIVQASSVNAMGLSYSPEGHHRFYELPVTERHPILPEDPYATSKAISELQASAITRLFPKTRISSLRFHMVKHNYTDAVKHVRWQDGFAWTSYDASSSACLKSLTSGGWTGHQVFNITAPEICWEGGLSPDSKSTEPLAEKKGTLELMRSFWADRFDENAVRNTWFQGDAGVRRSTWDSTKAEEVLGWDHDTAAHADLP